MHVVSGVRLTAAAGRELDQTVPRRVWQKGRPLTGGRSARVAAVGVVPLSSATFLALLYTASASPLRNRNVLLERPLLEPLVTP